MSRISSYVTTPLKDRLYNIIVSEDPQNSDDLEDISENLHENVEDAVESFLEDRPEDFLDYAKPCTPLDRGESESVAELEKLASYLRKHYISHSYEYKVSRYYTPDNKELRINRAQIIAFDDNGNRSWDAICSTGSYGQREGLLEIMGDLVDEKKVGDRVEGYLTADDVIARIEGRS